MRVLLLNRYRRRRLRTWTTTFHRKFSTKLLQKKQRPAKSGQAPAPEFVLTVLLRMITEEATVKSVAYLWVRELSL